MASEHTRLSASKVGKAGEFYDWEDLHALSYLGCGILRG